MKSFIRALLLTALTFFCLAVLALLIQGCAKPKDGINGATGQPGASVVGPAGSVGATGPQGIPGIDTTPMTIIQFCPGFVQSYPSTFAESGFCIGGIMYGVYSANNGFIAELPPGVYSSNGINASCTFTLESNCVVVP